MSIFKILLLYIIMLLFIVYNLETFRFTGNFCLKFNCIYICYLTSFSGCMFLQAQTYMEGRVKERKGGEMSGGEDRGG